MAVITWTKSWTSSDDGSPFAGADVQNIQNNITAQVNGGLDPTNFAATLTFADGDYIDMSQTVHNDSAAQGIRLPQIGASPTAVGSSLEGFIGWDQTNNNLEAFDGTNWLTVPTIASAAAGDIMYFNGTIWTRLAKGTAAQTLKMNAGATAPEWVT